jgi:pyrroline-5-carboxylate reductase
MTLGFIGTGNIASAVVAGLCASPAPPGRVLVSPRGTEKAFALAAAFPAVEVAPDNQAVVDGSATVVLAVRPQDAERILTPLRFRAEQRVISLLALTPLETARELVAPAGAAGAAGAIVRALPLPSCAERLGPIVVYPGEAWAMAFFAPIGTPLAVVEERELNVLWALTALIASYFALIAAGAGWAANAGVAAPTAGTYLATMFHALSTLAVRAPGGDFEALTAEAMTPGGLNRQALDEIRAAGGFEAFLAALDAILARLGEAVPKR